MAGVTSGAVSGDPSVETSVDWNQVRAIVGARWRIMFRRASEKWWKLVLAVLGVTMFAAIVAGLTVGAFAVAQYARADPELAPLAAAGIHAAFLFVLISLSVSPALGLRGNEFLDVTKLFIHPVNHRTVFAASLLSLLTTNSVLIFTLPLLGAVAGWGGGVIAVLGGCLAVLGNTATGVAIGQTGLLLFLDVFRSRKWRDLSRLFVALLSAGVYAGMRFASAGMSGGIEEGLRRFGTVTDWLIPVPSWWGANAVVGVGSLRWLPALGLPVLVAWLVRLAAHLQERTYFGEFEERRVRVSESGGGFAGWWGARLPGPLGASVEKDLRVLLRDPTIRILLIQQFAFAIMPLVATVWTSGGPPERVERAVEWIHAGLPFLPVMLTLTILTNPLGTEGAGLQHALLTPVPRSTLLLAKTISMAAVLGVGAAALAALGSGAIAVLAERAGFGTVVRRAAFAALQSFAVFGVFAGVGSILGAAWPVRIAGRDRRALGQAGGQRQGCLGSLARGGGFIVSVALVVPVGLAFHHPAISRSLGRDSSAFLALTIPAALAWGAFAAWAGSRLGGGLLAAREEAALAGMTRSEE